MTSDRSSPAPDQLGDDARELGALGYAQELFRTMAGSPTLPCRFNHFHPHRRRHAVLARAGDGRAGGDGVRLAPRQRLHLAVALSMAELSSSLPTSGAMYHWACRLGGAGWGWFTAWFNIIGQLATLAGIDYGCALFVTPLAGCRRRRGTC